MDSYRLLAGLGDLRNTKTIIVAIGNILKADDAAGVLVCEKLKGKVSVELIDAGTVPENYIEPIIKKAPENIVIIDAVDFGAPAGTIRVFKPEQISNLVISTHALSPRLFIDIITQRINCTVHFIGIQPARVSLGSAVSVEIERAVEKLVGRLAEMFALET